MKSDQARLAQAVAALETPIPDELEALMELWRVVMGGINALGGWLITPPGTLNPAANPRVFELEPGKTIRARVLELQERWVELNRGDRPNGPCQVCKHEYEYEVFPSDAKYKTPCGGCATQCGTCGITHEQSPYRGGSNFECIRALGKAHADLLRRVDGHIG